MCATAVRVENLVSGWGATAYLSCDKDKSGHAALGTAEKIVSVWGPDEATARDKIYKRLMEES